MPDVQELKKQLSAVEKEIVAARARMPAHSAKPAMMNELIELEDKRDQLLEQIARAEGEDPEK
jgi:hypothetical protein